MASSKARQRKLERQRYERKLVRMAQKQRRKRRIAAVSAILTLALVGVGVAWLAGAFESEPEPEAADRCNWLPRSPEDYPDRTDVGTPPENPPTTGSRTMTIALDAGDSGSGAVTATINAATDPCGTASMEYLAGQGFYDDTTCHALVDGALRCGDPSGTGEGGAAYSFYGEDMPLAPPSPTASPDADQDTEPIYPAGTVALADVTGENGSQFLIFYQDYSPDQPIYPVLGSVTDGLDVVKDIGKAGGTKDDPSVPAEDVRITSLTVTDAGETLQ